jgi:peroxiredoxin
VVVPGNLVDHLAQRWILLHKYFSALAHGSTKEIHRFEDNLHEVEQMVLVMFGPRPSESLAAIDAILAEERSDA